MSLTEIILAIISSSVLSSVLTSFFNWRIHNLNYKKDYYKKLLDKRLDSYEKLNTLIRKLSTHVIYKDGMVHGFFASYELYQKFIFELHRNIEKSFWLDHEAGETLSELRVYLLNNVENKIDDNQLNEIKDEQYRDTGQLHYKKIREFNENLKKSMKMGIKKLYKIDKFFDQSDKKSKLFPVYRKEN